MQVKKLYAITTLVVIAAAIGYVAIGWQERRAAPSDMHGMDHGSGAPTPTATEGTAEGNPVVEACREANARMHEAMSGPGTGDADRDFAAVMIAHHQRAIDMATILLQ